MVRNFLSVEEIVADDLFISWYYKGSASEVKEWEEWLRANPQQQPLVDEAILFMQSLALEESPVSQDETTTQLNRLSRSINEGSAPVIPIKRNRTRWWMAAAAAVVLLFGTFAIIKMNQSSGKIGTTYGEVCSNKLPDGSTMILNANSTARLSDDFGVTTDREIWLDGEAFFQVAKTPQKTRFIVHTNNLDVIVTGTQFNVHTRDGKTTVLLTEGSVTLRTKDGKELAMQPGDFVEMGNQLVERKDIKEENVLAWKDNRMAFDNTPLSEVATMITNHYGVKITLSPDVSSSGTLTGIMSNNNLDDLLTAIGLVKDLKITRNGKEIILSSNN